MMTLIQRHDDAPSSSFKLKVHAYLKNMFETGKPDLEKPIMISYNFVVFVKADPG
jgi:hypothetical protein